MASVGRGLQETLSLSQFQQSRSPWGKHLIFTVLAITDYIEMFVSTNIHYLWNIHRLYTPLVNACTKCEISGDNRKSIDCAWLHEGLLTHFSWFVYKTIMHAFMCIRSAKLRLYRNFLFNERHFGYINNIILVYGTMPRWKYEIMKSYT